MADLSGQLHRGGSQTLDASGNAVISFMPDHGNQRWEVEDVTVSVQERGKTITVPSVEVLVNGVTAGAVTVDFDPDGNEIDVPSEPVTSRMHSRGGSRSGNEDTLHGKVYVGSCDVLNVVFRGGIPGTTAYANVEGTFYTRRG